MDRRRRVGREPGEAGASAVRAGDVTAGGVGKPSGWTFGARPPGEARRKAGPRRYPLAEMPTRYLIFGALVTALVILVGVGLWFLLGVL